MIKVTIIPQTAPYAHDLQARTHTIVSDVGADLQGGDAGPTPHELLLLSLGACGAMTIEMFAKRGGIPVTKVTVTVTEDTIDDPDEPGKKIPHIVETFDIEGNLTVEQLASLERVAKKCPVYKVVTGKKVVDSVVRTTSTASAAPTGAAPATVV